MTLPRISGTKLPDIVSVGNNGDRLRITDFETGALIPWHPTYAQKRIWLEGDAHQKRFVGKPRRIMASTALDFERVLFAAVCDAAKQRVRAGVFLDVEGTDGMKIRERVWQMRSFLEQMGIDHEANTSRIQFPNGSEIIASTAGGERAAASTGFQRIDLEEFSYYQDPQAVASILGSASIDAQITICTTVDITGKNGAQARHYWREDESFHNVFFCVEHHPLYRANPGLISEDQWTFAQQQGFTDRGAAAYWLTELLSKVGGDQSRLMHEFPQIEEHMFAAGTGRWVRGSPKKVDRVDSLDVAGVEGDTHTLHIYHRPEDCGEAALVGVDTASGKGRDRSVVVVVGQATGRLLAAFVSDQVFTDDLVRVAWAAQRAYSIVVNDKTRPAIALIEQGGVGDATSQQAERRGMMFDRVTTTEESRYRGLLEARRAVEAGIFAGPKELAEECDELHRDELGRFVGRKDCLMAYGFCALRREGRIEPQPSKPAGESEHRIDGRRIIRQIQAQQRQRWW